MNRQQIIQFANVFVENTDKEESALVELLMQQGVPEKSAERFVAFLPIAFGRVVIEKLGHVSFSSNFMVKEAKQEFSLDDEPIFVSALELAAASYRSGLIPKEQFSAIALRSAELDAVNKALNEGENINGANFGPVVIWGYKTLGKQNWFQRFLG